VIVIDVRDAIISVAVVADGFDVVVVVVVGVCYCW